LLQIAIDHVQVGAAHTAGMYLEQDFISSGFGPGQLSQPQRLALRIQNHGFHVYPR